MLAGCSKNNPGTMGGRQRWQNTLAGVCSSSSLMFYMGTSPLVESINQLVPEDASPYLAPGVTVLALHVFVTWCFFFPLFGHLVHSKRLDVQKLGFIAMLRTSYPLFIGIAADSHIWWLQYVGAFLGAPGFACALMLEKVVAIQWWSVEGRAHIGGAIVGASMGLGSQVSTVITALLFNFIGLSGTMYINAGLIFLSSIYPAYLAWVGELRSPLPASPVDDSSSKVAGQKTTVLRLLSSIKFWQLALHCLLFQFVGMGMKGLLSPIFSAAFSLPNLTSALYAAASLTLFSVTRGVVPLLAQRLQLSLVCSGLLFVDCVLFALSPRTIEHTNALTLAAVKTCTGAAYAGIVVLQNLLCLEVLGSANFGLAFPLLAPAGGIGWALGPVIGYYIYLVSSEAGVPEEQSYNPFFYACAVLAFIAGLNLVLLQLRRQPRLASQASPAKPQQSVRLDNGSESGESSRSSDPSEDLQA